MSRRTLRAVKSAIAWAPVSVSVRPSVFASAAAAPTASTREAA